MKYNPDVHHRHSIRLKDYDYSNGGMYYITICTQNRECILSEIVGADSISAQLTLTNVGEMINNVYLNLENQFKNIKLHDYIIMPNHIHGIVEICASERADMESAPTANKIIQTFKRYTTIEYIKGVKQGIYKPFNKRIWQRNYYEHIIRNEDELDKIIAYIKCNPFNWANDINNKKAINNV